MIDSMQPSRRTAGGSLPRTLPTEAQRRQFIAAEINRGHFVHAEQGEAASNGGVVTLAGPLASYEDRLVAGPAGSRAVGAPVLIGHQGGHPAAAARAGQRMRWPGDLGVSSPADAGAPGGDTACAPGEEVARRAAVSRARTAALRLALRGGSGANPGPGDADLDVPAWWLEERARVQDKEAGCRSRLNDPA
jgi:hypothetical protein